MIVTFLGTGTSQGIPMIGCGCEVCCSVDFRDNRLRTSLHLDINGKSIVIDSGPDFRQQILRQRITYLDAIIFTHEHKDHTAGLDDIRGFNYRQQKAIPVYARRNVIENLKREFHYAFAEEKYPGIPDMKVTEIDLSPFEAEGVPFVPIEVMHMKLPVLGFRTGDFTYITDANFISEKEQEKIKGSKVIVLNGLQKEHHLSHFTIYEAVELLEKWKPEKAFLTHISHRLGLHAEVEKELPSWVRLAYDGLKINI